MRNNNGNLIVIPNTNSDNNHNSENSNENSDCGEGMFKKNLPQWLNLIIVVLTIIVGGAFALGNITKEISTLSEKVEKNNENLVELYKSNYNDIKDLTKKVSSHDTSIEVANERIKNISNTIVNNNSSNRR